MAGIPERQSTPDIDKPKPIGWYVYWTIVGVWILILIVFALAIIPLISFMIDPFKADVAAIIGVDWFYVYLLVVTIGLAIYLWMGIKPQTPDQWGIKLLLGSRAIQVTNHGPVNVLWPIFSFVTLTKETKQNQYPADDKEIDWERNADQQPAPNKVAPIRATTKEGEKVTEKKDPLERRMTINLSIAVTLRICDPLRFLIVMGGGESGLNNARKQIEDVAVSMIVAAIGKQTASWLVSNVSKLNLILEDAIHLLVGGVKPYINDNGEVQAQEHRSSAWGVEVVSAILVRYDLPQKVNEEMRKVPAAQFAKESTITAAEASRKTKEEEGAGDAEARRLLEEAILTGVALGLERARAANMTVEQAISVDVAKTIANSTNSKLYLGESAIAKAAKEIAASLNS